MTILNKTHNEEGAASCLVVGAENKALYILDPAAFTYLSRVGIEHVYTYRIPRNFRVVLFSRILRILEENAKIKIAKQHTYTVMYTVLSICEK